MNPISTRKAVAILCATVLIAHLLIVPMVALTKINLDLFSFARVYLFCAALLALMAYTQWRRMRRFTEILFLMVAGLTVTIPVIVSTYAAASLEMPLADDQLMAMDRALGFDWPAFIAFIDESPFLARILQYSYQSLSGQLLLLPSLLVLLGKATRGFAIVFAYVVLCLLASLVSIWYPVLGTYVSYGAEPETLANINAYFGYSFLPEFNGVREAQTFTLALNTAAGIITFPSVHAGVAVLCAWGAWESRWLRYPFLITNSVMFTSAISHANHYLVDVIAGAGLAAFAIAIATGIFYVPAEAEDGVKSPVLRRLGLSGRAPAASSN